MRMLYDEMDEDSKPYKEDGFYLCRNCATKMRRRAVLCGRCAKAKKRERAELQKDRDEENDELVS